MSRTNHEEAVRMLQYLLEELQPSMFTNKKLALGAFEDFYFSMLPVYVEKDVQTLLRGQGGRKGLMFSCGQVSLKTFKLKRSAGKALGLLHRLCSEENPHALLYRQAVIGAPPSLFKSMRLSSHEKTKNGNGPAARFVLKLIRSRQSLMDLRLDQAVGAAGSTKAPKKAPADKAKAKGPAKGQVVTKAGRHGRRKSQGTFSRAWSVLSNFFTKRPNRDELRRKGVLRQGRFFGRPLAEACSQHGINGVPKVLVDCLGFLRENGLREPGIFRVSGDLTRITELKRAYDFEDTVDLSTSDIHSVAGLAKLYLRELPEPLMTFALYEEFVLTTRRSNVQRVKMLAKQLPDCHQNTFDFVLQFLAELSLFQHITRMTEANLAIVFSPNVLRPRIETYEAVAQDTPVTIKCLKMLIEAETMRLRQSGVTIESISPAGARDSNKHITYRADVISSSSAAAAGQSAASSTRKQAGSAAAEEDEKKQPPATKSTSSSSAAGAAANKKGNVVAQYSQCSDEELPRPWLEYMDTITGRHYYYNPESKGTTWVRPKFSAAAPKSAVSVPAARFSPTPDQDPTALRLSKDKMARTVPPQQQGQPEEKEEKAAAPAEPTAMQTETLLEVPEFTPTVRRSSYDVSVVDEPPVAAKTGAQAAVTAAVDAPGADGEEVEPAGPHVDHLLEAAEALKIDVSDFMPPEKPVSKADEDEMEANDVFGNASFSLPTMDNVFFSSGYEVASDSDEDNEPKQQAPPQPDLPPQWSEHRDMTTNEVYYYNSGTQKSTWQKPLFPDLQPLRRDSDFCDLDTLEGALEDAADDADATGADADDADLDPLFSAQRGRVGTTINAQVLATGSGETEFTASIGGRWTADLSGGCHPNYRTWRNNPQITARISTALNTQSFMEPVDVTIRLRRDQDANAETSGLEGAALGFYVLRNGHGLSQQLFVSEADHVARSEFKRTGETTVECKFAPGQSYTLIPCTFAPGYPGHFVFEVHSAAALEFHTLERSERWQECHLDGEWKGVTAGGCRNHKTWENNPQVLLSVPMSAPAKFKIVVVLSQDQEAASKLGKRLEAIGCYVISKKGVIVGKARFMAAPEVHVFLELDRAEGPFILVPCSFKPGAELSYNVSVFSQYGVALVEAV